MDNLQNIQTAPPAPTCDFTISPLGPGFSYNVAGTTYSSPNYHYVFTNNVIMFTGIVNTPNGVSISEYYWNMGNGVELYGQNVSYVFRIEAPETRVSFCVTDNYRRQVCTGKLLNLRPGIPVSISGYVLQP